MNGRAGSAERLLWLGQVVLHVAVAWALGARRTGDSKRYLELADSLSAGKGFTILETSIREAETLRMPGYPCLLALVGWFRPAQVEALAVAAQQGALLLSVWLAWRATRLAFGELESRVFLALGCVYPFVAAAGCMLSPEAAVAPLVSGAWLLACRPGVGRAAAAGALAGLAVYLRPNLIVLGPALAAASFASRGRRGLVVAGAIVTSAGIVLLPWAARNGMLFGSYSPLPPSGGFGRVLLVGTWEARVPTRSLIDYAATGRVDARMEQAGIGEQIRWANAAIGVPQHTIVALASYKGHALRSRAHAVLRDEALHNMRDRPVSYLAASAYRTVRAWFTLDASLRGPTSFLLAQKVLIYWGVLVSITGLVGALAVGARARGASPGSLSAFALVACLSLTLCWFQTEARYTIPARHMLLGCAALTVSSVWRRWRRRGTRAEPQLLR